MTSNPHNPLPGEQPQDPRSGSGSGSGSGQPGPAQPGSGQGAPGQPRSGQSAPGQPASGQPAPGQPASGQPASARSAGAAQPVRPATAASSQPVSSRSAAGTQTMERPAPAGPPQHRRPKTKRNALLVILGLVAAAGIITGFALANNNTTPAATGHKATIIRPHARPTAPVRTGHLLTTFNGVGAQTSAPFRVTSPAFVHYGFKCASGTHAFSASMATTTGTNRQSIASTTGSGTSQATTVHPANTASSYRISANSACPYFIKVYSSK